jgi:hypothetical protein
MGGWGCISHINCVSLNRVGQWLCQQCYPPPYCKSGQLVVGNEGKRGGSYQNGPMSQRSEWVGSHIDAGGGRGAEAHQCKVEEVEAVGWHRLHP